MAFNISCSAAAGKTIFATAQKVTAAGSLGDTWNNSSSAWSSSVADADAKISMTEGSGRNAGSYTGGVSSTLADYSGDVLIRFHDDSLNDVTIATGTETFSIGVPVDITDSVPAVSAVLSVNAERTWYLRNHGEMQTSQQIVSLVAGTTATLAMDFSAILNEASDLVSVGSVECAEILSGIAPAIGSVGLSPDRQGAHFSVAAATVGKYRINATVTSTDGQIFVGSGLLTVH